MPDASSSLRSSATAWLLILIPLSTLTACDVFTDAGTRLAYEIEAGASRLKREEGARHEIRHTPGEANECRGPYTVQLDKVGALVVWCKDDSGKTVASGSTTYHSRFIDTPKTYIVDKEAGTTLVIEIQRRGGRAVVINVN